MLKMLKKINDYRAKRAKLKFINECDKIVSAYNKLSGCGAITWSHSERRLKLRDQYITVDYCYRNNEALIARKGPIVINGENVQSITAEEVKDFLKQGIRADDLVRWW